MWGKSSSGLNEISPIYWATPLSGLPRHSRHRRSMAHSQSLGPKIFEEKFYNGAQDRLNRLGLNPLMDEIRGIVTGFPLLVKEATDANGGAAVRTLLDQRFDIPTGWTKKQTGDVDWSKCLSLDGARVSIAVEIQFSARSDLVVIDLIHLRKAIVQGKIDIGVLIVPSDRLGVFLTDRGQKWPMPNATSSKRRSRTFPSC